MRSGICGTSATIRAGARRRATTPRRRRGEGARPRPDRGSPVPAVLAALTFSAWSAACDRPAENAANEPDRLTTTFEHADSLRVTALAPGVRHVYAWDARGPWAIHVVEVEWRRCDVAVEARKAGPPLAATARVSDLAAPDDVALINGDFFLLPEGTTTGAHVHAGEVLIGPGARPVFAVNGESAWIGRAELAGHLVTRGDTLPIDQVNRTRRGDGSAAGENAGAGGEARLFTHWFGDAAPANTGAVAIEVRRLAGSGATGRGIVAERVGGTAIGLDTATVAVVGWAAAERLGALAAGDTVEWRVELRSVEPGRAAAREAVGGFPELLRDGGRSPAAREGVGEAFGETRHPRTAVGIGRGGAVLLLVVVDGRQAPYSDGMTLEELSELLLRLGADQAINLDGGGSTTLVVGGDPANRPSDVLGERAVANALAVRAASCP